MLAGYRRVSHVGGRKHLRSPEDQAREIETWARARGHDVEMLPPELDAKGSNPDRHIFRQAVEGVKAGRYRGIVVAYLSRAGRDLRLMLDLWDEIEAAGGVVYSARENIDGSTPAGRLHRNLLASIDQHALEERSEGFEHARRSSVKRGIWQRRQTPRGYRRDPDTRRLVPDEHAEDVRQAARDLLAGHSTVQIATNLGMTPSGVRHMLRNRVYIGELRVGKHANREAHEPILDLEVFEAVQLRMTGPRRPKAHQDIALLAGLVRCASCGHIMTRKGRAPKGPSYSCPAFHSGERCPAPAAISCTKLDRYIDVIAGHELSRLHIARGTGGRLEALRAETVAARAELSAYLEAVDAAGLGPEAAAGMRTRRQRVNAAEEAERNELARAPVLNLEVDGAAAYRRLNATGRNHVLRGLLAAVAVRPAGRRGGNPPVGDRVRVLRSGAPIPIQDGRTRTIGIQPFWPDGDSDYAVRLLSGE